MEPHTVSLVLPKALVIGRHGGKHREDGSNEEQTANQRSYAVGDGRLRVGTKHAERRPVRRGDAEPGRRRRRDWRSTGAAKQPEPAGAAGPDAEGADAARPTEGKGADHRPGPAA